MGGADAVGVGVEVVGAVSDVFCKAEGVALICQQDDAARKSGQSVGAHGFAAQVGHGGVVVDVDGLESVGRERCRHCE